MMKKELEGYIERSLEIRGLSMPPKENGINAGEFYALFNKNFMKIKELLRENRTLLEREVFRPFKHLEKLEWERAKELMEFANQLANTQTLEMVDVRMAWLIFENLCEYYKRLYETYKSETIPSEKSETVQGISEDEILDRYIFCLHKVATVGYNVIQGYDKGRTTDEITQTYREAILKSEDKLAQFLQPSERFGQMSVISREKILECALFRGTAYECLYYDEDKVRNQISCYERYLKILGDPGIQKAAPELEWDFETFSGNMYLAMVSEYLYWHKVPEDILQRLKLAAEDALAYVRKKPDNFRQNIETTEATLHTIQAYLGEISIPEMIETYEKWLKGADETRYDWMSIENNLLPVTYTLWLCQARPEWIPACRKFLVWTQKWTFDYISKARDNGAYECMQRFISYIMDAYIELEDGISFRRYYENILVVTQPTLYVHCRMVTRIALCILDELYQQDPELLLYANGCETMEEVHASIEKTKEFLFNCCMFHDVGKLYFLDTINLFGRALFSEEFDLIRLHPVMGWELLKKRASTRDYAEAALYHHLWYDEKGGYPQEYTYKGNDNAILYQIITCADCLDAATDSVGRAYSVGKNFEDMLADLRCNAGRMFNPELVALFDSENLQKKVKNLITVDREQLYLDVFARKVKLIL